MDNVPDSAKFHPISRDPINPIGTIKKTNENYKPAAKHKAEDLLKTYTHIL